MNPMQLYKLSDQYAEALTVLNDSGLDEQTIADTLEGLEGEVRAKCENVALWRENQLVIAKAKRDASKRLADEAKAIEGSMDKLMEYLDHNMTKSGIDEISCEYFTIKYRKNPPSVNILDADKVPSEFVTVKTTESISKTEIKKAIQDGREVEGAELVTDKRTLTIK